MTFEDRPTAPPSTDDVRRPPRSRRTYAARAAGVVVAATLTLGACTSGPATPVGGSPAKGGSTTG
ncbi:MAG: hypothetical protein HOQ18_15090, partial [Dermatophilaceae bacterium]|nr:hypothetical protein [Dermatophilaceae bacterium]